MAQGRKGGMLAAVLIGAVGSALIWVVATYNNFYYNLGFISDSYLPIAALFLMLVLAAVVNPVLRRYAPARVLTRRQLVLIFTFFLVASVLPGQGLMRQFPYMLARGPVMVSTSSELADGIAGADIPAGLFPEPLAYGHPAPAAAHFLDALPRGAPIPWGRWVRPMLNWGVFLLCMWMFMVGLAMVVFPQWRYNERLPFPLLAVYRSQLEEPEPGRLAAPVYGQRIFWIGAIAVFGLYLLKGGHLYFPDRVPDFPLQWKLSPVVANSIFRYMHGPLLNNRIYFMFVGIAFFMPVRISFSIWFTALLYGLNQVYHAVYAPPHNWAAIGDNQTGAMFALTAFILWLGRAHWAQVGRCMLRRVASPEDRFNRAAGWLLLAGAGGMFGWLVWMGVAPRWALLFVVVGLMAGVMITRIVAETGMPFIRMTGATPSELLRFASPASLNGVAVFLAGMMGVFFHVCSRVNLTTMVTHSMGLDDEEPPAVRTGRSFALLPLLAVGLVVCMAVTLNINYRHNASVQKAPPINRWGGMQISGALKDTMRFSRGDFEPGKRYDERVHMLSGAVMAGGLQWACLNIPRWPLHPIGILLFGNYYGDQALASVFLGWAVKVLVLRYGGARSYRNAQPLFLGVVMGEVFAAILWGVVSAAVAVSGRPFEVLSLQPY